MQVRNSNRRVHNEPAKELITAENKVLLFTTKTCPNCYLAKEYLQNIDYTIIDAEENMELAVEYGIMQAPTLVVVEGQSQKKYVNASNIKKYAEIMRRVM